MGTPHLVVDVSQKERRVLGTIHPVEGFGTIYHVCDFLEELAIDYNCIVDTEKFADWQRLYLDFFEEKLRPLSDAIYGLALMDLRDTGSYGTGSPELIVYNPGASVSFACDVYTIEDGEVKAVNTRCGLTQYTGDGTLLAPLSKNAGVDGFFANPAYGMLSDNMLDHSYFIMYYDRIAPNNKRVYILNSGNGDSSDGSWCDYYLFGTDEQGYLDVEMIFSYKVRVEVPPDSDIGSQTVANEWFINGTQVTEAEYDAAREAFDAMMEERYHFSNTNYGDYCVTTINEDVHISQAALDRGVIELIELVGRHSGYGTAVLY